MVLVAAQEKLTSELIPKTYHSIPPFRIFWFKVQNILISICSCYLTCMIIHISLQFSSQFQESSPTPQFKSINFTALSFLYGSTLTSIHDYWKNHSFDYMNLCWQVMALFFNMLSRLVIAFFARSKTLLISWLQSPSALILQPKKIKSVTVFIVSPLIFL